MWITQPVDNKNESTCFLGVVMLLGEERYSRRSSNGPVGHCGYVNSQYDHAIEFGLDLGGGQLEYTESGNLGGCRCNTGWELGGGQLVYTESWNLGGCRCNTSK